MKSGEERLKSKYELDEEDRKRLVLVWNTMLRPRKLFFFSPVVLLVGIVSGVGICLVHVVTTSLPDVYKN